MSRSKFRFVDASGRAGTQSVVVVLSGRGGLRALFVCMLAWLAACAGERVLDIEPGESLSQQASTDLPRHARDGDPVRGRALLLNNGTPEAPYLSCGVPRKFLDAVKAVGIDPFAGADQLPGRERGNQELRFDFSYATTRRGVEVVTSNCLLCHASKLGDGLIIGLGNPNVDFTQEDGTLGLPKLVFDLLRMSLTPNEAIELERFMRVREAAVGVQPDTIGMNAANVMFGVVAAHRDPRTWQWFARPAPESQVGVEPVYTDVPAWWNMHRRDRMFYSGSGRGDHARIMMSAALTCLEDDREAAAIDAYFPDIEAYIRALRPPKYEDIAKRPVDRARAGRGRTLFVSGCAGCHGDAETGLAPRHSVGIDEVGTDPGYAIGASQQGAGAFTYYFDFFNQSWLGRGSNGGRLERAAQPVYSAPPLDGVWATAPYFHNGSVPTLDAVLDARLRPMIFRRSFDPAKYDFERLGWPYEPVVKKGQDVTVYDTTRKHYRNGGHTFAAGLSDEQRRDLLEYLKTL